MRKTRIRIVIALLIAGVAGLAAAGQEPDQARDLFHSYSQDGMSGRAGAKVRIELRRGSRSSFVSPDTAFRAGDKIKFHFETNFAAYVKIYNRGSSGKLEKLFPYPGVGSRVKTSSDYVVPAAADEWFEFDKKKGVENLYFSFSSESPNPLAIAASRPVNSGARNRPPKTAKNDVVTVRKMEEEAEYESEINEADWVDSDSRDINRVKAGNEEYIFGQKQNAGRIVRITFELRHN